MDTISSSPIALYFEIFLIFLSVAATALLYILVRSFIRRVLLPKGKAAGSLLSRLNVPIVFLIVTLILKIELVRNALFPSQRFHPYFDAALVFFFIVFLIRLVDGILLGWHERRRVEFPLPKVLHSFSHPNHDFRLGLSGRAQQHPRGYVTHLNQVFRQE